MPSQLGHEKLEVYQRALQFVSWTEDTLAGVERNAAVLDHLDRACASVVEAIANGNSRRSAGDRNQYFDVAVGSGLECASCLDVCECKQLVTGERQAEGKVMLRSVVRMTIRLRGTTSPSVREEGEPYMPHSHEQSGAIFFHEKLGVYQAGLELVRWTDCFLRSHQIASRHAAGLDKTTTSLVLNIAEGNGRFSSADHRRFLDIAHTCSMNAASGLDLLVARNCVGPDEILEGKQILGKLVPLLLGLRGYLDRAEARL